jgi:DNA-binding Lrp family transcriptional regulator
MHKLGDLDAFDLRILAALQENGRLTNQELGERVGLSASQCSRRRTSLEATGLIRLSR